MDTKTQHLLKIEACLAALLAAAACASTTPAAKPTAKPSGPAYPPAPASKPTPPAQPASGAVPSAASFKPDDTLKACPKITVENAPKLGIVGQVLDYQPFARVRGSQGDVLVAIAPVNGACLTSGFGTRAGGQHKGIDLQTKPANMIHAAAAGLVREAGVRADYGNYVVIDHGGGVFTRYAHLVALAPGVKEGATLPFGADLGVMGNTAGYQIPIHLHYELLVGDYETAKKSFGLTPTDIFVQPRAGGVARVAGETPGRRVLGQVLGQVLASAG